MFLGLRSRSSTSACEGAHADSDYRPVLPGYPADQTSDPVAYIRRDARRRTRAGRSHGSLAGEWLAISRELVYPARMSGGVRIAPSILSADLGHLAREIAEVEAAGADWIHVDVVDGRFAPHLTFGPAIVKAARRATRLPIDVHLMVDEPERYLKAFADAGADHLTVHGEACRDLRAALQQIRALGKRAGVALKPETPIDSLRGLTDAFDLVLVLCVSPGQSGQAFMESQLPKIAAVREMIDQSGQPIDLEVDGGISSENTARTVAAGARVLVSGSKIFDKPDRRAAIAEFRRAAAL